jgi:hypothetical protein
MEVPKRTYHCDRVGCQSYCDPALSPGESITAYLAQRGWQTVDREGKVTRHYCPVHHEKRDVPDAGREARE